MNTIKCETKAVRNQFGKLSGSYSATIGPFSAVGASKEEAIAILGEKLELMERHMFTRPVLVTNDGTVFILSHQFEGWAYDIIHTKDTLGAVSPSACLLSCKTFTDAFNAMKRHWEQMNVDCAVST